jgi:hypothetical protein
LNIPYESLVNGTEENNYTKLFIERYNVGYMVGAVLSWVSILAMVCGFIIGPLMEKLLDLMQAEILYHI